MFRYKPNKPYYHIFGDRLLEKVSSKNLPSGWIAVQYLWRPHLQHEIFWVERSHLSHARTRKKAKGRSLYFTEGFPGAC